MVEMDGGVGVGAGGGGEAAAARRWRLADERCDPRALETDYVRRFHRHEPRDHQCSSAVAKHIKAPVHLVWSLVRRFDQPQLFKPFVSRCEMKGNIEIGSVREVNVKSGLPATRSTERLELLDDNEHILSVRFVGGDHRLKAAKFDVKTPMGDFMMCSCRALVKAILRVGNPTFPSTGIFTWNKTFDKNNTTLFFAWGKETYSQKFHRIARVEQDEQQ